MIYRSNLTAPDLRPYFKLADPPILHAGHDEPSDPDFMPYECGFWTDDEAAILFNVASRFGIHKLWADIGCRVGWTSKHINWASNSMVVCVDPELAVSEFRTRFFENTGFPGEWIWPHTSEHFFQRAYEVNGIFGAYGIKPTKIDGFVIDGCHDAPEPLNDAKGALAHAADDCVILFHDFLGPAVREGVTYLMDAGFRCRIYWTPNCIACCWRGEFTPPDHVSDPLIDFAPHKALMTDFDLTRCE